MPNPTSGQSKIAVTLPTPELFNLDAMRLELWRVYGIRLDRTRFLRYIFADASLRKIAERARSAEAK